MRSMQLKHLRTFLAVASTLSFTKAGQKVHLAQSSVTEQIQALEADLGALLFERSQRKLKLTDAGASLVEYAEALLSLAADARAAVAGSSAGVDGSLAVGALETLCTRWLPQILGQFQAIHPNLRVDLRAAGTGELRNAVKDGSLDVCFAFTEPPDDAGLHSELVGTDDLVVLLPRAHAVSGNTSVGALQVADERFLVTAKGCAYRTMFDQAFPASGNRIPPIAGEYGSLGAIVGLVRAGLGVALLPRLATVELDEGLVALPWDSGNAAVAIHMIWRPRQLPAALRQFLDAVRSHQPVAAVDVHHAARREAVSHEETDRFGNVIDMAHAARR